MSSIDALCCEICEIWDFDNYSDFSFHHLAHVRDPKVNLVKLSERTFQRLLYQSYRLSTGVARRTVSPLKISLKKVQGKNTFIVNSAVVNKKTGRAKAVEGNNGIVERLGAGISIKRRGSNADVAATKIKQENSDSRNTSTPVLPPDLKNEDSNGGSKETLLEKLSGIGGISFGKKKDEAGETYEAKPSGLLIASKSNAKEFDIEAYRSKLKEKMAETKANNPGNLLAKLSGISGISFGPKEGGSIKTESEGEKKADVKSTENDKEGDSTSGEEEATDDSDGDEEQTKKAEEPAKPLPETSEPKVRVSTNLFAVKEETAHSEFKLKPISELVEKVETVDLKPDSSQIIDVKVNLPEESGINILERLTERLNEGQLNTLPKAEDLQVPQQTYQDDDDDIIMEEEIPNSKRSLIHTMIGGIQQIKPPSPTPSEQLHPDFMAPAEDAPTVMTGQLYQSTNGPEQQAMLQQQGMAGYTDVSCLDSFTNQTHLMQAQQPMMNGPDKSVQQVQSNIDYSGITAVNPSLVGEPPSMDGNSYWTDVGTSQPQQDPLMTSSGQVTGTEAMNQAFLQNFLSEQQQQAVQHAIPNDGAEFVSLDRLAQGVGQQHMTQQQLMATPGLQQGMQSPGLQGNMQQGLQNVQNNLQPSMQSMMPPGMPGNMQQTMAGNIQQGIPPAMPQLFQGFNVFNQTFPQPTQQPPMLQPRPQPRPQITPRSFQSMAAPTRQRSPRFTGKRPMLRLPNPQEMTPPKQRKILRMPSPTTSSSNSPQNRSPVGVQVTPPKKTAEANKVANVLASRGITVTSSTNNRPQQQQGSPRSLNPALLNLSSQISVTPSSQNRNSGGFATPGNRRSVVNHEVERPDRCTTVDLTIDDEPPQRNSSTFGSFPCNMCSKVFTSSINLKNHKSSHRAAGTLAYKCDKCSAQYPSLANLNNHKQTFHKDKPAPDLALPVVDINHPGAKDRLLRCGFTNFIPLSQLQSNSNGIYGIPIINLETAKEKVISNLNSLGASNIFILGKLKPLSFPNR